VDAPDSFVEMGKNDERQLGLGWHSREQWGDRVVRWTSDYGIAFLRRPSTTSPEVCIELECYAPRQASGSVLVNDKPVGWYRISPASWTTVQFRVKTESEVLKLTILPLSTVVPRDQSWSDDARKLGLAVASIRAKAAPEGSSAEASHVSVEQALAANVKEVGFLERITSPAILNRLKNIYEERPEVRVISYILDHPRILEWVHSVGVCSDDKLRSLVPPFPPEELRKKVAPDELEIFLWTGLVDLERMITLYEYHRSKGDPIRPAILDFGCGCGRMSRFLNDCGTQWSAFACDVNGAHVDWCKKNLKGVQTSKSGYLPPLQYKDEMFNLIYCLSVFSHLKEECINQWFAEFHRILAPSGILIATTHGFPALETIRDSEMHQKMFRLNRDEVISMITDFQEESFIFRKYDEDVLQFAQAGPEYGNTFIHLDYIHKNWNSNKFKVLRHLSGGLRGWQDIVVLQRK
jgi:SAM-dependent methyltransferase